MKNVGVSWIDVCIYPNPQPRAGFDSTSILHFRPKPAKEFKERQRSVEYELWYFGPSRSPIYLCLSFAFVVDEDDDGEEPEEELEEKPLCVKINVFHHLNRLPYHG